MEMIFMNITFSSICEKLGFNPMITKPVYISGEDDTQKSPFSVLSVEEIDFLYNYMKENEKYMIFDDHAEHWKKQNPNEYAELEKNIRN